MENRNNAQEPLLQVRGLSLRFPVKQGLLDILMRRPQQAVTAVDDVDLAIYPGECLGLVGESGCGKSTLAKTIIRIYDPDAGTVTLDGVDFTALKGKRLQAARRSVQMVFQDPYSSLNPRMSVGAMLQRSIAGASCVAEGRNGRPCGGSAGDGGPCAGRRTAQPR
ncbi:hypothetical protein HMPREF1032_02326 [Subdoligranulum sp. 4_3_54A2FAA]|nr:hypothetical protein HMPREF1032_02326 [Subdoligranulum sp. 4_3_54A2FAA]